MAEIDSFFGIFFKIDITQNEFVLMTLVSTIYIICVRKTKRILKNNAKQKALCKYYITEYITQCHTKYLGRAFSSSKSSGI